MDEQTGIDRERRMMESGSYEELDWSFLDQKFAHLPEVLAEMKARLASNKAALRSGSEPIEGERALLEIE